MGEFDSGSAWLMQHFGRALLGLAGVTLSGGVTALAPKLVVPTRVPDGLLQADVTDPTEVPELYLLEFATRGETRLPQQTHDDLALSRLALKRVPNGVAFVLWPHAAAGLAEWHREESSRGWSSLEARWKVLRCYELDAAEVLARREAGLAPLVLVARTTEPAPRLAEQVRKLVDTQVTDGVEQANLLAVCQVFSELRYNNPQVLEILGGRRMALQSAWMRAVWADETARVVAERTAAAKAEGKAEGKAESLVQVLRRRFRDVPPELEARVSNIDNEALLDALLNHALSCRSLQAFVRLLPH